MSNDACETDARASPFINIVLTLVSSDGVATSLSPSCDDGTGALEAAMGETALFGDPFAAMALSLDVDGTGGCVATVNVSVTGEVVLAGLPIDEPTLDTLACL